MAQPAGPDPLFLAFQLALAGRYSIDREIGRGGMGIVFLAREVHLDRPVAIKLLPPERLAQPTLRERFLREARLAAKLSHPNIIPIHSVEETGGFVYYVMAYVDGQTLADRVRLRGPLTSTDGARVLREVAWALAYAHSQGVVHRDVKPDNILLEAASGRALVADFGIAAAGGEVGEGIVGTPEFMSPEQALGKDIDARSDIYALGATAFFAFSGRLPFEGQTSTEVLAKQVTEAPPALGSLGLTVPRKLAAIVDRCLAKEREHRPVDAQSLAEQLGVALEQRREVPAALRAFVKRSGRLDGGGTLVSGFLLLPTSVLVSMFLGDVAGYATFVAGGALLPLGYLANAARKLLRQGFNHADLESAFRSEVERAREEMQSERGLTPPSLFERLLPRIAGGSLALTISLIVAENFVRFGTTAWVILRGTFFVTLVPTIVLLLSALIIMQRRSDMDISFWSRVWLGRLGRGIFAIARRLKGTTVGPSALTHRATELSLGLAAEQLYDALPRETRKALGNLPTLLHRLQRDARSLRLRHDRLQEAIADAGDAGSLPSYDEVRATRDQIHARLSDAVGALETIRLNLLRMHAGSATVEGFTTHLDIAAEVSEQVERLVAAQESVEFDLSFPREPTPTPA